VQKDSTLHLILRLRGNEGERHKMQNMVLANDRTVVELSIGTHNLHSTPESDKRSLTEWGIAEDTVI